MIPNIITTGASRNANWRRVHTGCVVLCVAVCARQWMLRTNAWCAQCERGLNYKGMNGALWPDSHSHGSANKVCPITQCSLRLGRTARLNARRPRCEPDTRRSGLCLTAPSAPQGATAFTSQLPHRSAGSITTNAHRTPNMLCLQTAMRCSCLVCSSQRCSRHPFQ